MNKKSISLWQVTHVSAYHIWLTDGQFSWKVKIS